MFEKRLKNTLSGNQSTLEVNSNDYFIDELANLKLNHSDL